MNGDVAVTATFAVVPNCPPEARVPAPPRNFQAQAAIRAAFIAWAPPADDGGCPVHHYHVLILQQDHAPREQITRETSLYLDGFDDGLPVCFGVSAVNPVGQGPIKPYFPGGPCTDGVNMPDVPLEPISVIAYPRNGSADVYWNPPLPGNMLNRPLHAIYPITNYRVVASPGDIAVTTPDALPLQGTDTLHATVSGLTDGIAYSFTVVGHSEVGDSKPSKASNSITPPTSIWKPGAMLPFPWWRHASVASGEYLYAPGPGFSSRIGGDGTPGPWKAIEPFNERPFFSSAVFAGDNHTYIYAIGGLGHASEVLVATLRDDGTVSSWTPAGPQLEIPRAGHGSAMYKNFLYVIGGLATWPISDVSFAILQQDGRYAGWTKTTPLPIGRDLVSAVLYKNFLYVISSGIDVFVATLGEDGSIQGPWRRTTAQLRSPRERAGAAVVGDKIYVAGGETRLPDLGAPPGTSTSPARTNSIFVGHPDPTTGDVTSWDDFESDAFFGPRETFGFLAIANRLYVIGGMGQDGGRLSDVQFANIDPATGHLRP
jgi:hypothetical protein